MKQMILFGTMLVLMASVFTACGKKTPIVVSEPGFAQDSLLSDNQASWLAGTWQARGESGIGYALSINLADNRFTEEVPEVVGRARADGQFPASLLCLIRRSGNVKVESTTDEDRRYFHDQGKTVVPELSVQMRVEKTELIDDPGNGAQCAKFVQRASASGTTRQMMRVKKVSDAEFVDAWDDLTYLKK